MANDVKIEYPYFSLLYWLHYRLFNWLLDRPLFFCNYRVNLLLVCRWRHCWLLLFSLLGWSSSRIKQLIFTLSLIEDLFSRTWLLIRS